MLLLRLNDSVALADLAIPVVLLRCKLELKRLFVVSIDEVVSDLAWVEVTTSLDRSSLIAPCARAFVD